MNQIYDFKSAQPPRISEDELREKLRMRAVRRQTLILRIASFLCCLCYVVFALFILRDSLAASVVSLMMMTVTLIGNGLISVVFLRRGMSDHQ